MKLLNVHSVFIQTLEIIPFILMIRTHTFSATRNLALLERGLRFNSSGAAVIGFW